MKKILLALLVTCFVATSCKNEKKEATKTQETTQKEVAKKDIKEDTFKISGMSCEISCAKVIASKLSKKEGVIDAKVVFKDSLATVKYDASKTNTQDLKNFIGTIGKEGMYKASSVKCKKACCSEKKVTEGCGNPSCKSASCASKDTKKKCDNTECKKASCSSKTAKKSCNNPDCKSANCTSGKKKKSCDKPNCKSCAA